MTSQPQAEPAGGPFLRTTPATKVEFHLDGVKFTDPDGTEHWEPYPDDDDPGDDT